MGGCPTGLIFRQDGSYLFCTIAFSEAAYALIPEGEARGEPILQSADYSPHSRAGRTRGEDLRHREPVQTTAPHVIDGTRKGRWRRSTCVPGEKPRRPRLCVCVRVFFGRHSAVGTKGLE